MSGLDVKFIKHVSAVFRRNSALLNIDLSSLEFRDKMLSTFSERPEFVQGNSLNDHEIATTLFLCGIDSFESLAAHIRPLLLFLERKTCDNTGDLLTIVQWMHKCIKYLPNRAQEFSWELVRRDHSGIETTHSGIATAGLCAFEKYARTFSPLFAVPPPVGWPNAAVTDWSAAHLKQFLFIHGDKNPEYFVLPNLVGSGRTQAALEKVRSIIETGMTIHYHNMYHPPPSAPLAGSTHCLCGLPYTTHPQPWKPGLQKIRVIGKPDPRRHIGSWNMFDMQRAVSLQDHVDCIAKKLNTQPTDSELLWAERHGGVDSWKRASIPELDLIPESRSIVAQLRWFTME